MGLDQHNNCINFGKAGKNKEVANFNEQIEICYFFSGINHSWIAQL